MIFYSQLKAELLEAACALAHENLADTRASRETDLANRRVFAELLAHSGLALSLADSDCAAMNVGRDQYRLALLLMLIYWTHRH